MDLQKSIISLSKLSTDNQKALIDIVLSDLDDEEKLTKIRRTILEYTRDFITCHGLIGEHTNTLELFKKNVGLNESDLNDANANFDKMESLTELMKSTTKISKQYSYKTQAIGMIMFDDKLNPTQKIEKISICLF